MEVTLWRARRIKALPRDAAMAREMFKAAKNSFTPADKVKFPSPVMFAIVLERSEVVEVVVTVRLLRKSPGQLAVLPLKCHVYTQNDRYVSCLD